jgi:hypothetical protein
MRTRIVCRRFDHRDRAGKVDVSKMILLMAAGVLAASLSSRTDDFLQDLLDSSSPWTQPLTEDSYRGQTMPPTQGDSALLTDPIAQELLQSTAPARLAYTWHDGTPRVIPIWFHWTGEELVLGTPVDAPKVAALEAEPAVAVTIDSEGWPPHALLIRGRAAITTVDGVPVEYAAAARRYLGESQGGAWATQAAQLMGQSARIAIRPDWVAILDFETRFPSALARRMGQG